MEGCKKPNYSEGKLPIEGKQHRVLLTEVPLTEVRLRKNSDLGTLRLSFKPVLRRTRRFARPSIVESRRRK
jgi:hypothetical protein